MLFDVKAVPPVDTTEIDEGETNFGTWKVGFKYTKTMNKKDLYRASGSKARMFGVSRVSLYRLPLV